MPTVLRQDGFSIMIFTRDHDPMHVHVYKSGGVAIILLEDCDVRKITNMKENDVARARHLVFEHRDFCIENGKESIPLRKELS